MPHDKRAEYLAEIDLIREGAIRLLTTDNRPSVVTSEVYQEALRIAHDVWDGVIMAPEIEAEEEAEDGEDWKNN